MYHIIYSSIGNQDLNKNELDKFLDPIRKNNKLLNVTGMLLYSKGSFLQVLEGEEDVVKSLYNKISKDTRHSKVTKIVEEPIYKRDFENWSMGCSILTNKDIANIDGINDFFTEGNILLNINYGKAKKLLQAFSKGYWQKTRQF